MLVALRSSIEANHRKDLIVGDDQDVVGVAAERGWVGQVLVKEHLAS